MTSLNYREIYDSCVEKFKSKIKDKFLDSLFPEGGKQRGIDLKQIHLKKPQDPEPITVDIIRLLLRQCGIDPLDITREYVIEGTSTNVFKKVKKKPDFFIESFDPEVNGLLFEIEHLNKQLDKEGDGEGIEQAREWYSVKPSLFNHYDSIITNFTEWYFVKCNKETEDFDTPRKMLPWEIMEIIVDRKFGLGREYKTERDIEKATEITNKFYNGFQERLKQLLSLPSTITIDIEIKNFKKDEKINQGRFESQLTRYYRTIFSRLLFIKILESWKLIKVDPLSIIFKGDKRHWGSDLRYLFFDVFNQKKENRPKDLPKAFLELDYLNGGLFRPSGIEMDDKGMLRNVQLNSDAIKDIWDFFKGYRFLKNDSEEDKKFNTINPEILGYIFERSIGDERKLTGSYYTREEITNYMVENVLYRFIIDKVNIYLKKIKVLPIKKFSDINFLENSEEIYYYIISDVLKELKICDPACGSGAFLEKSAEKLLNLYKRCYKGCGRTLPYRLNNVKEKDSQMPFSDIYSIKKYIIQNILYGVDINPFAIEICELRLWLWIVKPSDDMILDPKEMNLLPLPNIEYNLRVGNSLIGYQNIRLEKAKRIDETSFLDIIEQKKSLIDTYYLREDNLNENKENIRKNIDKMIEDLKSKLNTLLLQDYRKREIIIPAEQIEITSYPKDINLRKKIYDEISELNKNCNLCKFKINFIEPADIQDEELALLYSKERKTGKIKSISSSSKFKFGYYSEYGDYPLSKIITKLIPDWSKVQSIEFEKLIDMDDLQEVNPFHWFMEFSEVAGNDITTFKGFDIIIGNPPFIRIENIDEPERELYKKNYQLAEKRFDIYLLFYELSQNILKVEGYLSLVSSNKFLKSQSAENMRNFIRNNFSIKEIVNFNNYNAFQGVNIKTLLIFLKKTSKEKSFPYISVNDKTFQLSATSMDLIKNSKYEGDNLEDFSVFIIDEKEMNDTDWEFYSEKVRNILKKLECEDSTKLKDLIKSNRQGVVTAANNIFIVNKEIIDKYHIESEFVYKIVKGEEIRRWQKIQWSENYLIYPYQYDTELRERKKIDFAKEANLNVYKYLTRFKEQLLDRYCVRSGNKEWYELHDPVSPSYFLSKKLMFPDISLVPSFSIDLNGEYFSLDTNYSIIPNDDHWLFYLLAILNSFIMEIYIRFKFQTLSKEFRFKTFLVNEIPIIHPNKIQKEIFDKINTLAEKLYENYSIETEKKLNLIFKELYQLNDIEYKYILKMIEKHHDISLIP